MNLHPAGDQTTGTRIAGGRTADTRTTGDQTAGAQHIATFCGQCDCGCPQLWFDHDAEPARQVVLTDDHGQRIQLSVQQLDDLHAELAEAVAALKAGA